MDCIHLAQDGVKWWALVNIVLNFCIPQNAGSFLIAEELFLEKDLIPWSQLLQKLCQKTYYKIQSITIA
jgi:hypothetical protein